MEKQSEMPREPLVRYATLAFSGGISGAFGAVYCNHTFANAETGNLVSMAYDLKNMDWIGAGARLVAVLLFMAAIVVTVRAPLRLCGGDRSRWARLCLLIEAGCFALQLLLPYEALMALAPAMYLWPVFFASALQYNTFNSLLGVPVSTVFIVNNLRQMTLHYTIYRTDRSPEERAIAFTYFCIIASFFAGALFSIFLQDVLGRLCLLGCIAIQLGNCLWLHIHRESVQV